MLFFKQSEIRHGPGAIAPQTPTQTAVIDAKAFDHEGFSIVPLANFAIEARVLSKEQYWFDGGSDLSPVDLALGWGNMSDERVLDGMEISQSGRWYRWRVNQPAIPLQEIARSSANMHMVPADDVVEKQLDDIVKGDLIKISGYLIKAQKNNWSWRSSLTRNDTGADACELIFVKHISVY